MVSNLVVRVQHGLIPPMGRQSDRLCHSRPWIVALARCPRCPSRCRNRHAVAANSDQIPYFFRAHHGAMRGIHRNYCQPRRWAQLHRTSALLPNFGLQHCLRLEGAWVLDMHDFPDHCVCWIPHILPQRATEQTVEYITYICSS